MLGRGCYFKNQCAEYARANAAWRKARCDSDSGCEICSYRPKNDGNKEAQRLDANLKRNQSDTSFAWIFILIVVGIMIYFKFFA